MILAGCRAELGDRCLVLAVELQQLAALGGKFIDRFLRLLELHLVTFQLGMGSIVIQLLL